jgi:peptidoglycan/xylan/chitin deacetylase (PgdA/CDA1 family)
MTAGVLRWARRVACPLSVTALLLSACAAATTARPAPGAVASDPPAGTPTPDGGPTPDAAPSASASATPALDDFGDVPEGDQPIGMRFPPPPASLRDLTVRNGHGAEVHFTFDDGPSRYTRQVLAALATVDAPAVFCLVGDNAVARPEVVRAILAAGHALCDHTRDHSRSVGGRDRATVKAEINGGLREIRSVAGDAPVRYYRQPYGAWTPLAVEVMYAAGLNPLRWTDDPRDWSRPGTVAIAQRVLLRLRPGAVILMHDGGADRSQTVAALRWLLPHLRDAGWRFTLAPEKRLAPEVAARPE